VSCSHERPFADTGNRVQRKIGPLKFEAIEALFPQVTMTDSRESLLMEEGAQTAQSSRRAEPLNWFKAEKSIPKLRGKSILLPIFERNREETS
jgi:hypothetical protein